MQLHINLIFRLIPSHLFLRSHREGPDPNSFDMIFTWTLFFLMRIEDYFCSTETECLEGSSVSLISVSFLFCSLFFPIFLPVLLPVLLPIFFSQLTLKPVSVSRFLFLSCFHFCSVIRELDFGLLYSFLSWIQIEMPFVNLNLMWIPNEREESEPKPSHVD